MTDDEQARMMALEALVAILAKEVMDTAVDRPGVLARLRNGAANIMLQMPVPAGVLGHGFFRQKVSTSINRVLAYEPKLGAGEG